MVLLAVVSGCVSLAAGIVWAVARIKRDRILRSKRHVQTYGSEPIGDPAVMLATERSRLYDPATRARLRRIELAMRFAAIVAGVGVAIAIMAVLVAMPDESDIY